MKAKGTFYALIIVLILCAGMGGAVIYFGQAMLQKQGDKLVGLKLIGRTLNEQQAATARAKQDVQKYTDLNHIAKVIVPQEKDQALTVRELVDLARDAGIKIGSVTFPASNLGAKGAKPSGNASNPLTQVVPVPGISGVYQLPITLQSDTSAPTDFPKLISFLQSMENNRHTAQVSQLTITPSDTSGKRLSFVLIVNVYIKP